MKIHIWHDGDRSVGIPWDELVINWPGMDQGLRRNASDLREQLRRELIEFWSNAFDFPAHVRFDDECPDCRKRMTNGSRCTNPHCVVNLPDSDDERRESASNW
jgi:hypothetical protein